MSSPGPGQRQRVAVVADDDVEIRRLVARHLRALDFAVHEADDGGAVQTLVSRLHPDLICLDLNMPRVSGYAVLRWLRSDEAPPDIPVIVLTARTGLDDHALCREFGALALIEKPFRAKALKAELQRLLNRWADTDPAQPVEEKI